MSGRYGLLYGVDIQGVQDVQRGYYILHVETAVCVYPYFQFVGGEPGADGSEHRYLVVEVYSSYFQLDTAETVGDFFLQARQHLLQASHPDKAVNLNGAFSLGERGGKIYSPASVREIQKGLFQTELYRREIGEVSAYTQGHVCQSLYQLVLITWSCFLAQALEDGSLADAEPGGVRFVPHLYDVGEFCVHHSARGASRGFELQRVGSESESHQPGNLGNCPKSGSRFSRNAFLPSCASSIR